MEGQREPLARSALGRRIVACMMKMGSAVEARGAWLCNFANRSLDDVTPADFERLRCEALAWAIGRPDGLRFAQTATASGLDEHGVPPLDTDGDPAEAVRSFHTEVRGTLWRLLHDGRISLPIKVTHDLTRRADGSISRSGVGAPGNSFRSALSDLLVELGPRLRRCQALGCGNVFVARRRQQYCSGRCSQATRTATHFRVHPEKAAKKKRLARQRKIERTRGDAVPVPGVQPARVRNRKQSTS